MSIPRRVNGELYGSFLPGSPENLERAVDGLTEFLPSGKWFDQTTRCTDPISTEKGDHSGRHSATQILKSRPR